MKYNKSILLSLIIFTSCNPSRFIFTESRFDNFGSLTLPEATKYDEKLKSEDVTPAYLVQIGEDIYPNEKKFKLNKPKSYRRIEGKDFLLNVEYFYTLKDSSVKIVLYEWNHYIPRGSTDKVLSDNEASKKYKRFAKKFQYLKSRLTKELGEPTEIEINSTSSETSFRDGIKWIGENKPKAYLFMLGNNENQYRKLRLAIYNE